MLPHCVESWQAVVSLDAFHSAHFQASILALHIQPGQFHLQPQLSQTCRHWLMTVPFSPALDIRPHLQLSLIIPN